MKSLQEVQAEIRLLEAELLMAYRNTHQKYRLWRWKLFFTRRELLTAKRRIKNEIN